MPRLDVVQVLAVLAECGWQLQRPNLPGQVVLAGSPGNRVEHESPQWAKESTRTWGFPTYRVLRNVSFLTDGNRVTAAFTTVSEAPWVGSRTCQVSNTRALAFIAEHGAPAGGQPESGGGAA
jgi:hypothetical protein